jgi:hypothetical protein
MNDHTDEIEVPQEASEFVEPTQDEYVGEESSDYESDAPEVDDDHIEVEVSNSEELWDAIDLQEFLTDPEDEDLDTDDAEADDAAFPSEDYDDDAEEPYEESPEYEDEEYEEYEEPEITEEELADFDFERPAPLSRRKAEKVVKSLIEPLRDPNTPIDSVIEAMTEFHPTRTQQMAEKIVQDSIATYPDEWLQSITGVPVTVEQIREWAEQGGSYPSNTAPAFDYEASNGEVVETLNETYGDDWKNPAMDDYLLDEDVPLVKAVRAQAAKDAAYAELQQELEATRAELESLKPEIENIKMSQEQEVESLFRQTLDAEVESYRTQIESRAIPKVLETYDLYPRDSDSSEVRDLKQLLLNRFQPVEGYGSEFDIFLEKQFSGKEGMNKALARVGSYLVESSKLAVQARKTGDPVAAKKAEGLKEQAKAEQDALTVWTRKAATEFLSTSSVAPIVSLLEKNYELQQRVQRGGRTEIIGQTTAVGANSWRNQVKEAKEQGVNPFDLDITDLLSSR